MSDNINWVVASATGWMIEAGKAGASKTTIEKIEAMIKELACNEETEKKVRERVLNATPEEETAIWEELEQFKRRHPDIIFNHPNNWGHVGSTRFPFTRATVTKSFGKKTLNKSEEEVYIMNQGQVVTMLINTQYECSRIEATRIAFTKYLGSQKASWTIRFG